MLNDAPALLVWVGGRWWLPNYSWAPGLDFNEGHIPAEIVEDGLEDQDGSGGAHDGQRLAWEDSVSHADYETWKIESILIHKTVVSKNRLYVPVITNTSEDRFF